MTDLNIGNAKLKLKDKTLILSRHSHVRFCRSITPPTSNTLDVNDVNEVTIFVSDSKAISRIHAKMQFKEEAWTLQCLGKNGLYVNETFVSSTDDAVLLSNKDRITIVETHIFFLLLETTNTKLKRKYASINVDEVEDSVKRQNLGGNNNMQVETLINDDSLSMSSSSSSSSLTSSNSDVVHEETFDELLAHYAVLFSSTTPAEIKKVQRTDRRFGLGSIEREKLHNYVERLRFTSQVRRTYLLELTPLFPTSLVNIIMEYISDGTHYLVQHHCKEVSIIDSYDLTCVVTVQMPSLVTALTSVDSSMIVTGDKLGVIKLWSVNPFKCVFGHGIAEKVVNDIVAFRGHTFSTDGTSGQPCVWILAAFRAHPVVCYHVNDHHHNAVALAPSSTDTVNIVVCRDFIVCEQVGKIMCYSRTTLKTSHQLILTHANPGRLLALSSSNSNIIIGSDSLGVISLFDVHTNACVWSFPRIASTVTLAVNVTSLCLLNNNTRLAVSYDNIVSVYHMPQVLYTRVNVGNDDGNGNDGDDLDEVSQTNTITIRDDGAVVTDLFKISEDVLGILYYTRGSYAKVMKYNIHTLKKVKHSIDTSVRTPVKHLAMVKFC